MWTTEFSQDAEHDFELIFDHLFEAYTSLGDTGPEALEKASIRIEGIRASAERITVAPYRGTLRDGTAPEVRTVTIDRAIFWFEPDEAGRTARVPAIFFGGRDHIRHMMACLLDRPDRA